MAGSLPRMPRTLLFVLSLALLAALVPVLPGHAQDDPALSITCTPPFPVTEGYPKDIAVTASDAEGLIVDIAVVDVDPDPSPGTIAVTGFTPSPEPGADATAAVTVDEKVPGLEDLEERYTVTIRATNDADEHIDCVVHVEVVPIRQIGAVQGAVPDDVDGRAHPSPFNNRTVAVQGVVTQKTMQLSPTAANPNRSFHGFFVQNYAEAEADRDPRAVADGDPTSSDGIFVFHSSFPTLRRDTAGFYTPQVGDEVVLRGPVTTFFGLQQLNNPFHVDVVRTGVDVEEAVEIVEADPPDDFLEATVYWERLEGMQVRVPEGSRVVGGRDVFASSRDGEVWVIRGDHPVAQRDDPLARRVFRDAHPLDNDPTLPADGPGDGNGYRILMASHGIKAAEGDARALIAPARTYDTVTNAPAGGLTFGFGKYQIQVAEQPELAHGVDPATNHFPTVDYDRSAEYSVMVYNVENLYDFRDDPFSGCDLNTPENTGCDPDEPGGSSVTPPFTYAPSSQEEYDTQRRDIAEQIAAVLNSPDIVTVQEAEKQDICMPVYDESSPADSFMDCQEQVDNSSGAPDVLEELALEIFAATGGAVRYEAAADAEHGRDVRGITSGFLYRSDRVELVADVAGDPLLGADPDVDYPGGLAPWVFDEANPKSFNAELPEGVELADGGRFPQTGYVHTRGPQVALFRIWTEAVGDGSWVETHVFSNHFSSNPTIRVGQRTEQASFNAALARAVLDAGGRVQVTGDLNVYPRPDDPFPSPETDPTAPPSDQLAGLYEAGLANLYDVVIDEAPVNAYSFIFQGQSQVLDQILVDNRTLGELEEVRYVHVNTDFPADDPGSEPGRGASDHDPLFARYRIPVADVAIAKAAPPGPPAAPLPRVGDEVTFTMTVRNDGPDRAENVTVTDPLPDGVTFVSAAADCSEAARVVTCDLGHLEAGAEASVTVTVRVDRPGRIENAASVTTTTIDPEVTNDESSAAVVVRGPLDPPGRR